MRARYASVALVCALHSLGACSEPRVPAQQHALGDPTKDLESTMDRTVRRLAVLDARVARSQNVSITDSDREAAAVAHQGGADEPAMNIFAFTDRLTTIDAATRALREIRRETLPPGARPRYDAFAAFLSSEERRAKSERDDPSHAISLVRAVCDTWAPTTWPNGSLAPHLSRFASRVRMLAPDQRSELDAALNQLERYLIESAHTEDVRALSELREALALASGPARAPAKADSPGR